MDDGIFESFTFMTILQFLVYPLAVMVLRHQIALRASDTHGSRYEWKILAKKAAIVPSRYQNTGANVMEIARTRRFVGSIPRYR